MESRLNSCTQVQNNCIGGSNGAPGTHALPLGKPDWNSNVNKDKTIRSILKYFEVFCVTEPGELQAEYWTNMCVNVGSSLIFLHRKSLSQTHINAQHAYNDQLQPHYDSSN